MADTDFKVNSDFLAFRIPSSIDNIYEIVDRLNYRFEILFEKNSEKVYYRYHKW